MKNDVYQIITDRVIRLLESGTVPWHQPWKGNGQAAQNLVTRKAYRGVNCFLLNAAAYPSPFWLTYRQALALGGNVKKGEHAFPVVFWKMYELEDSEQSKEIPVFRYHSVFNLSQCEGIQPPVLADGMDAVQPLARCDAVVNGMPLRPVIHHGRAVAVYSPSLDQIAMPQPLQFESMEAYYSTLLHELTHATGHPSRLNRKDLVETKMFGSDPYCREELVAEMGAAFLCGHCGIADRTVDRSASYIQHWLTRLQDDRRLVVQAAALAQKACDFILRTEHAPAESTAESASRPPS